MDSQGRVLTALSCWKMRSLQWENGRTCGIETPSGAPAVPELMAREERGAAESGWNQRWAKGARSFSHCPTKEKAMRVNKPLPEINQAGQEAVGIIEYERVEEDEARYS